MSEADDLAQRYLTLWTQYLTALLADPRAMETLKRWASFAGRFDYPAPGASAAGAAPVPPWPPFFGPFGMPVALPGASGDADTSALAALERRVAELERRLVAVERPRKPRPTRRVPRADGR